MNDVDDWFFGWFTRHKARNPHNGWAAFEASSGPLLALGWVAAFEDLGVTEAEADKASVKIQCSGETWPIDHLAKLLAILRPVVDARRAEERSAERVASTESWHRELDRYQGASRRWFELPNAERASRTASIVARYPSLKPLHRLVTRFAIAEWQGQELPDPASWGFSQQPATNLEPPPPELPLTAGQVEFLAALSPGQREAFEAMTPGRRRLILEPHAAGLNRELMLTQAFELVPPRRREEAESEAQLPTGP
jgi:hypothetical protein